MEQQSKVPCVAISNPSDQQIVDAPSAGASLSDVLRELDLRALDVLYDRFRALGCLARGRVVCRALRDALDGSVQHARIRIKEELVPWLPPLHPRPPPLLPPRKNAKLPPPPPEPSSKPKPPSPLQRFPRCDSLHVAVRRDWLRGLEEWLFEGVPADRLRNITQLILARPEYAGDQPEPLTATIPSFTTHLPALRRLDLGAFVADGFRGWPKSKRPEYQRMFTSLKVHCPHLEALVLPGWMDLCGVDALAGSLRTLRRGRVSGEHDSQPIGVPYVWDITGLQQLREAVLEEVVFGRGLTEDQVYGRSSRRRHRRAYVGDGYGHDGYYSEDEDLEDDVDSDGGFSSEDGFGGDGHGENLDEGGGGDDGGAEGAGRGGSGGRRGRWGEEQFLHFLDTLPPSLERLELHHCRLMLPPNAPVALEGDARDYWGSGGDGRHLSLVLHLQGGQLREIDVDVDCTATLARLNWVAALLLRSRRALGPRLPRLRIRRLVHVGPGDAVDPKWPALKRLLGRCDEAVVGLLDLQQATPARLSAAAWEAAQFFRGWPEKLAVGGCNEMTNGLVAPLRAAEARAAGAGSVGAAEQQPLPQPSAAAPVVMPEGASGANAADIGGSAAAARGGEVAGPSDPGPSAPPPPPPAPPPPRPPTPPLPHLDNASAEQVVAAAVERMQRLGVTPAAAAAAEQADKRARTKLASDDDEEAAAAGDTWAQGRDGGCEVVLFLRGAAVRNKVLRTDLPQGQRVDVIRTWAKKRSEEAKAAWTARATAGRAGAQGHGKKKKSREPYTPAPVKAFTPLIPGTALLLYCASAEAAADVAAAARAALPGEALHVSVLRGPACRSQPALEASIAQVLGELWVASDGGRLTEQQRLDRVLSLLTAVQKYTIRPPVNRN